LGIDVDHLRELDYLSSDSEDTDTNNPSGGAGGGRDTATGGSVDVVGVPIGRTVFELNDMNAETTEGTVVETNSTEVVSGQIAPENTTKISKDLKNGIKTTIKRNLIFVGGLSYIFLFLQLALWYQLMKSGNFVSTNTYFSSYYFFTALHGIHLLGGLYFWGKVSSKIFKLDEKDYNKEEKSINALSLYWFFLFIVWLVFFTIMFAYNDTVIEFCKSLIA
jgi:hypothetical protein